MTTFCKCIYLIRNALINTAVKYFLEIPFTVRLGCIEASSSSSSALFLVDKKKKSIYICRI